MRKGAEFVMKERATLFFCPAATWPPAHSAPPRSKTALSAGLQSKKPSKFLNLEMKVNFANIVVNFFLVSLDGRGQI